MHVYETSGRMVLRKIVWLQVVCSIVWFTLCLIIISWLSAEFLQEKHCRQSTDTYIYIPIYRCTRFYTCHMYLEFIRYVCTFFSKKALTSQMLIIDDLTCDLASAAHRLTDVPWCVFLELEKQSQHKTKKTHGFLPKKSLRICLFCFAATTTQVCC